jgi:lantibiotic modifying enzyme
MQARAALADLSARLRRPPPSADASLWSGLAGIAVAHMALHRVAPRAGHRALAEAALEGAIAQLAEAPVSSGLSGLAGIGWVVGHIVAGEGDDDPCAEFDAHLVRALRRKRWSGPFDLIEGLVGVGVYGLERLPRVSGKRLIADVVRHLEASARQRRGGVTWWSNPRWFGARPPPTPWNLGLAHGLPGVIGLLGRIAGADVDGWTRARARELLERAVAWLLAQELPEGGFPIVAGRGAPRTPAALRWCYGDAGIAAALMLAARGAKEPRYEREAMRVALRAAARAQASSGVADAALCHGAAGVALVFHRLHEWTGEELLADAAREWFTQTLAMQDTGAWSSDPGLLTGGAGIALALEAATTDATSSWARVLLLAD